MEPFACRSLSSCDSGIQCELEILNLSYDVVLSISRDSKSVSVDVQLEGVQLQTRESGSVTNVTLPRPMNSNLSLTQDFDPQRTTVSMQVSYVQNVLVVLISTKMACILSRILQDVLCTCIHV